MPATGITATNSTTMPSPPSQWVRARHSSRPLGSDSMSLGTAPSTVAPVVLRPDIASK